MITEPIIDDDNPAREQVREYLDAAIAAWRQTRDKTHFGPRRHQAAHYVDAFQSVRASLLGGTLPEPDQDH
jgi:hypothetical protein